jgi:hypothetical protein
VEAIRTACPDAAGWLFVKYDGTPERFESAVAKNASFDPRARSSPLLSLWSSSSEVESGEKADGDG